MIIIIQIPTKDHIAMAALQLALVKSNVSVL